MYQRDRGRRSRSRSRSPDRRKRHRPNEFEHQDRGKGRNFERERERERDRFRNDPRDRDRADREKYQDVRDRDDRRPREELERPRERYHETREKEREPPSRGKQALNNSSTGLEAGELHDASKNLEPGEIFIPERPRSREGDYRREYESKERRIYHSSDISSGREDRHKPYDNIRERERDREHEREREKERERERERDREREREKERERDRDRDRDRHVDRDRMHSSGGFRDDRRPASGGRTWNGNAPGHKPKLMTKKRDKAPWSRDFGDIPIDHKKSIFDYLFFPKETKVPKCKQENNKLFAYKIVCNPMIPFTSHTPTSYSDGKKEYIFDGFLLITHESYKTPPINFTCAGIETQLVLESTEVPSDFNLEEVEWFHKFLFEKILYIHRWNDPWSEHKYCRKFHVYPRLVHKSEDKTEFLPLSSFNAFLKEASRRSVLDVIRIYDLTNVRNILLDTIVTTVYGSPAYRLDDIDFNSDTLCQFQASNGQRTNYFEYFNSLKYRITDVRQPLLYNKTGHANTSVVCLIPELTLFTGLKSDICQIGAMIPHITFQMRLYHSLSYVERMIGVEFNNKDLLKEACVHPSFTEFYLSQIQSCRQAFTRLGTRKRSKSDTPSEGLEQVFSLEHASRNYHFEFYEPTGELFTYVTHNQRLEFLGDAVLEFIVTSHLVLQFPLHREGELTLYRSALVNNKYLAHMAGVRGFDVHLIHALDLTGQDEGVFQHMAADNFEALCGAIYIDQGLDAVRKYFASCTFAAPNEGDLVNIWLMPKRHPLQAGNTDRATLAQSPTLMKFLEFEQKVGYTFRHFKMLVQAFTHPSVNTSLDLLDVGSNQRLEFLGDAVLQFLSSKYLFTQFPDQQEGQLTLLRSTLVNNNNLAAVSTDLGFNDYLRFVPCESLLQDQRAHIGMLADCLEALVGAFYLDGGLGVAETFLRVALFANATKSGRPRDWLDSKTRLQHKILQVTKSRMYSPVYRILSESGPPHMRFFEVGVFVMNRLITKGNGYSRQAAEQDAAEKAINTVFKE